MWEIYDFVKINVSENYNIFVMYADFPGLSKLWNLHFKTFNAIYFHVDELHKKVCYTDWMGAI